MKDVENYNIFNWLGDTDLSELSKKEAKEKFKYFNDIKGKRIESFKGFIEPKLFLMHSVVFRYENGMVPLIEPIKTPQKMTLDYSIDSIQAISDWITIEAIKYQEKIDVSKKVSELDFFKDTNAFWKSIATDISIYYLEVLNYNFDNDLKWILEEDNVITKNYPSITNWNKSKMYKDGILYHIICEIFLLLYNKEKKEDFLIGRLNYHMEELL